MMRLAEANLQTPASARASPKANSDERGAAKVKRDRWRIGLQGPALEMSDTEREFAGLVFERSLANLRT
jgi:hypothetical protein